MLGLTTSKDLSPDNTLFLKNEWSKLEMVDLSLVHI